MTVEFDCVFEEQEELEVEITDSAELETEFEAFQLVKGLDLNAIPEWALQPEKPTYTADEVEAVATYPQELTDEQINIARDNIHVIGENVEGMTFFSYTVDESTGDTITVYDDLNTPLEAQFGAEIYNDYDNNIAVGLYAKATGYQTQAIGNFSQTDGWWTRADGQCAHAEGLLSRASGHFTHAEGTRTLASLNNAHAEGDSTKATGRQSHAEGTQTVASGQNSHAEGLYSEATALMSHAEGEGTLAKGRAQTAMGKYNIGNTSHRLIVGIGTNKTTRKDGFIVDSSGNGWFAKDIYVGSTGGLTKDSGSKKVATQEYVDISIAEKVDALAPKSWIKLGEYTFTEDGTPMTMTFDNLGGMTEFFFKIEGLTNNGLSNSGMTVKVDDYYIQGQVVPVTSNANNYCYVELTFNGLYWKNVRTGSSNSPTNWAFGSPQTPYNIHLAEGLTPANKLVISQHNVYFAKAGTFMIYGR